MQNSRLAEITDGKHSTTAASEVCTQSLTTDLSQSFFPNSKSITITPETMGWEITSLLFWALISLNRGRTIFSKNSFSTDNYSTLADGDSADGDSADGWVHINPRAPNIKVAKFGLDSSWTFGKVNSAPVSFPFTDSIDSNIISPSAKPFRRLSPVLHIQLDKSEMGWDAKRYNGGWVRIAVIFNNIERVTGMAEAQFK
ncbi:hypothetical protein GQ43DRAFT_470180 [Delitschia confertaspora ATCC 74209]|uniref:Uncharacterized protein n=1 Tax=Delitschia confertaspora ATCC 74209 TaxID=1513339 RepID=A0A9P4MXI1_9PLEO|nr:hypothetical protein GQ43DRAFT_470180 [Delitschia confertaspora ATCC 74209]